MFAVFINSGEGPEFIVTVLMCQSINRLLQAQRGTLWAGPVDHVSLIG